MYPTFESSYTGLYPSVAERRMKQLSEVKLEQSHLFCNTVIVALEEGNMLMPDTLAVRVNEEFDSKWI